MNRIRINSKCHITYFQYGNCWRWRPTLDWYCSESRTGFYVKNRMQLSIKRVSLFIDWPMSWCKEHAHE